jgi:hypothetical protein
MNTLVERTIEAHGGLKRWNELGSVTAHLDEDGALWGLKGHPEMLGETNVTVGTGSEWAFHHPFLAARWRNAACTPAKLNFSLTLAQSVGSAKVSGTPKLTKFCQWIRAKVRARTSRRPR